VRPPVVVVAGSLAEAQGYAFTLPDRHVEIMTRYRATVEGGLHGLGPGTTIHVLPMRVRPDVAIDLRGLALEAELEHLASKGAVIKAVRR
jgi:hypothetical protein